MSDNPAIPKDQPATGEAKKEQPQPTIPTWILGVAAVIAAYMIVVLQ